ncbi:MAG: LabA [Parcubacteria group bacterium GW2011_GWB1_44_7]|nr:MAG: LabA [Parcubacteria group bacterium GW2011_GWB1_44_7]
MNEYESKLKDVIKGRVVVYIDAANLERSVKDMFVRPDDVPDNLKNLPTDTLCWSVDYKKLNEFFRNLGNFQGVRFYTAEFDSEGHHKFRYFLDKGLKFKLITKPIKEYGDHTINAPHRKANFDVEIAVDSTFSMKDFDTLILFSGDCDFDYLIKFLRGNEKVVIGFSRSGHVAKELPPALSHYFDIANFRTNLLQVGVRKAKSPEPFGPGPRN